MPDREPTAGHSAGLLRGLIWAGVGLAPVAAAVVLIGGSQGSTRFAVLLLAVSVGLVGASVLIRNDPALQRMDVEDRVTEEVRKLRRELRAEFGRPGKSGRPPQSARPDRSDFFRDEPMLPPEPGTYALDDNPSGGYQHGTYASDGLPGAGFEEDGEHGGGFRGDGYPGSGFDGDGHQGSGFDGGGYQGAGFAGAGAGADPSEESAPAFNSGIGGRASVPVASAAAAVRPVTPPGQHLAGMAAGPRPGSGVPRQRPGAAVPPAASAAVRPTSPSYGRADSLDSDFGATNGYPDAGNPGAPPGVGGRRMSGPGVGGRRMSGPGVPHGINGAGGHAGPKAPGVYGGGAPAGSALVGAAPVGNTYGRPAAGGDGGHGEGYQAGDDYGQENYGQENYGQENYGLENYGLENHGLENYGLENRGQESYGLENYGQENYGQENYGLENHGQENYGADDGYEGSAPATGDPSYKARRHRPSANDTNVGTLADFAAYGGYDRSSGGDERYVQGYDRW